MLTLYSEMVDMLGVDDARAVIHRLGGKRIYVPYPRTLNRNHKLVKELGLVRANRFCILYAGETLSIPVLAKIRRAELIAFLDRGGIPIDEIAWLVGITPRHVRRILSHPLPKILQKTDGHISP